MPPRCRPPFIFGYSEEYEDDPEYVIAAIAVSCCTLIQANVYILLRLLKEVHFAVIILVFGVVSTAISTAALFAFSAPRLPESATDSAMVFAVGFLSFLAQIALTQARLFAFGPISYSTAQPARSKLTGQGIINSYWYLILLLIKINHFGFGIGFCATLN